MGGYFAAHRGLGVRARNGRVYCRQPISPVIQVYSADGRQSDGIKYAPPFYKAGTDKPLSLFQDDLNAFGASWTEHLDFFPSDSGFVSVYTSFDTLSNGRRFTIFKCRTHETDTPSCVAGDVPLRPFALLGEDTLVTVERTTASDTITLLQLLRVR